MVTGTKQYSTRYKASGDEQEDTPMKMMSLAIAAGTLLAAAQANAGSFPVQTGLTGSGSDLIDQVAVRVYVHEGQRYCFYFDGWHGPGWYRCGFAFRRGLGWGGVYGWNDWSYAPYERRFGHRHYGGRMGVESGARRFDGRADTRTRSSTGTEIRSRATTGSDVDTGARVRGGGTTGSAPNADVQSEGSAKVQGGPTGEGAAARGSGGVSVGGGGNMGGGPAGGVPAGEGNPRR
jgi:hypothetical protein